MTWRPRLPPRTAWLRIVFATRPASLTVDLRSALRGSCSPGSLSTTGPGSFSERSTDRVFTATSIYFSNTAHLHPGGFFAVLAGLTEFGGAIALGLGLLTRLAGLAVFGDMVIAMITVTWATGINSGNPPPGYQLNLSLGVLALVVGMLGAGRFSVDAVIAHRFAKRQPPDEHTTATDRQSPRTTTPPIMLERSSERRGRDRAPEGVFEAVSAAKPKQWPRRSGKSQ